MPDLITTFNEECTLLNYGDAWQFLKTKEVATIIEGVNTLAKEFPDVQLKDLVTLRNPELVGSSESNVVQYDNLEGQWVRVNVTTNSVLPVPHHLIVYVSSSLDGVTYDDFVKRQGLYRITGAGLLVARVAGEFIQPFNKIKVMSNDYVLDITITAGVE